MQPQQQINPSHQQKSCKQSPSQKNISSQRRRNRRYAKLEQLRTQGYFSYDSIKLRHPLLYHIYLGQYDLSENDQPTYSSYTTSMSNNNDPKQQQSSSLGIPNLFSQFLHKNLLNLEYKQLLSQQLNENDEKLLEVESQLNEEQIKQLKGIGSGGKSKGCLIRNGNMKTSPIVQEEHAHEQLSEMTIEEQQQEQGQFSQQKQQIQEEDAEGPTQQTHKNSTSNKEEEDQIDSQIQQFLNNNPTPPHSSSLFPFPPSERIYLTSQQMSIQQQHLIEHCQELFLCRKLNKSQHEIDYDAIENDEQYDMLEMEEQDREDRYFNEGSGNNHSDEGSNQEENDKKAVQEYYTGIQDY